MIEDIDIFISNYIVWRYLLPTLVIFFSIGVGVKNPGLGFAMFLFGIFWYSRVVA